MNPLGVERLSITPAPVEASGTIIEFMAEGYAIEKYPSPVAVAVISNSSNESLLVTPYIEETDTAVTGEARDAVVNFLEAEGFTKLDENSPKPTANNEEDQSQELEEKRGIGTRLLAATRRSRLGTLAATTATAVALHAGLFAETARAESESVASKGNVPTKIGGTLAPNSPNPSIGSALEVSSPLDGIRFLDADTSATGLDVGDIETLKQSCIDEGLEMPEIFRKPVMYDAGIRPLDPQHRQSQGISGVFVYPDLSSCPPELGLLRKSDGQIQMQKRDNRKVWMNLGVNGTTGSRSNTKERSQFTYGPTHAWPDYLFNMCNGKGEFQKVRIILTNQMRDTETHQVVDEEKYNIEVGTQGNCAAAIGSKIRTKDARANWGG